jgi:hypothetical protein
MFGTLVKVMDPAFKNATGRVVKFSTSKIDGAPRVLIQTTYGGLWVNRTQVMAIPEMSATELSSDNF